MAINRPAPKQAARSTPADTAAVASMLPDEMLAGGLMDDFDGVITKVRVVPWDYNGAIDHHVLGVAVSITPDDPEEGDPFVQTYSAGDLEAFAPSMDGANPVDLENGEGEALEGIYALRVGKKEQLSNNSNWAAFLLAALDAGFPRDKVTAAVTFLEGTHAHFNRVPQKKRSGIVTAVKAEGDRPRRNDILVITALLEAKKGATKAGAGAGAGVKANGAAKATTTKPAAATADTSGSDLDEALSDVIVAALAENDAVLEKTALAKLALSKLPANMKAKGVKRIVDMDFLESGGTDGDKWAYDADSATLIGTSAE